MAAKAKSTGSVSQFREKPKRRRKGIHAKTKSSKSKNASNYMKPSRGQG